MFQGAETFKALLKANRYSVTRTRLAVFTALVGQEPLTMHELVARVAHGDRASVYRAIDLFERLGIVLRLNTGWKYKLELSDKFAAHHHHLTCTSCGKTVALSESELESVIDTLATAHGFTATSHQIEVQGTCVNCQTAEH